MPYIDFAGPMAKGLTGYMQGQQMAEQQQMQRQQFATQQQQMQMQLQQTQMKLEELQSEKDREDTYQAIDRFFATEDYDELRKVVVEHPRISQVFGLADIRQADQAELERLGQEWNTQQGQQAERAQGMVTDSGLAEEKFSPGAARFATVVRKDGSRSTVDMLPQIAATGYFQNRGKTQQELALAKMKLFKAEDRGALEKDMEYLQTMFPEADAGELQDIYRKLKFRPEKPAAAPRPTTYQLKEAKLQETSSKFESVVSRADFNPEKLRKTKPMEYAQLLDDALALDGVKNRKDIKLADPAVLAGLADGASQITPEQTGFVDSLISTAQSYLQEDYDPTNNVDYAALKGIVRHSLFGASLTSNEQKSAQEFLGSNKEKIGTILRKVRSMVQSKANEYDAEARKYPRTYAVLGQDIKRSFDSALRRVDERLNCLQTKGVDCLKQTTTANPYAEQTRSLLQQRREVTRKFGPLPGQRRTLEEIFNK